MENRQYIVISEEKIESLESLSYELLITHNKLNPNYIFLKATEVDIMAMTSSGPRSTNLATVSKTRILGTVMVTKSLAMENQPQVLTV